MLILACQYAHCDNANLLMVSTLMGVSMLTFANHHLTKSAAEADRIVLSFSSIWPEPELWGILLVSIFQISVIFVCH